MKAADWMNKNQDEARSILVKAYNVEPAVAKEMPLLYFPPNQRNNVASLEATQKILLDAKMIEKPVNVQQMLNEKLLEDAAKEMGSR